MINWSRLGAWTLLGLMVINVGGTAVHFLLNARAEKLRAPRVIGTGSSFPAFSGVDIHGVAWRAKDAPCRVIRITDDNCAFCKKDKPAYASFVEAARRASCEVIEIAPMAGKMAADPRPGVVQLKFVDADIGSVVAPFATPQTVIVDGSWNLKWNRRGIFDDLSLADGMAVLGSSGSRRELIAGR